MANRFFITPFRLKNDDFWRSVEMCKVVNPEQEIFCPSKTDSFLSDKWHTLSPENALMALEYFNMSSRYNYRGSHYRYESNLSGADRLFRLILSSEKGKKYRRTVLGSSAASEELVTGFLEKDMYREDNLSNRNSCVEAILGRKDLKGYQYELIYRYYRKEKILRKNLTDMLDVKLGVIPDYIFIPFFRSAWNTLKLEETKSRYGGSSFSSSKLWGDDRAFKMIVEGKRRGLLGGTEPTKKYVRPHRIVTVKELAEARVKKEAEEAAKVKAEQRKKALAKEDVGAVKKLSKSIEVDLNKLKKKV